MNDGVEAMTDEQDPKSKPSYETRFGTESPEHAAARRQVGMRLRQALREKAEQEKQQVGGIFSDGPLPPGFELPDAEDQPEKSHLPLLNEDEMGPRGDLVVYSAVPEEDPEAPDDQLVEIRHSGFRKTYVTRKELRARAKLREQWVKEAEEKREADLARPPVDLWRVPPPPRDVRQRMLKQRGDYHLCYSCKHGMTFIEVIEAKKGTTHYHARHFCTKITEEGGDSAEFEAPIHHCTAYDRMWTRVLKRWWYKLVDRWRGDGAADDPDPTQAH